MSGAWNSTRWLSAPRGSFKPGPGVAMAPHLRLVRPVTGAHDLNIWVADQLTLQIEVAVKFAPRDAALSAAAVPGTRTSEAPPEDVHRFLRQARCAAKIADPHLLQILEQGRVKGGIPFLVTELLEGRSLSQLLLSGPLPISHAHAVLSQAAGVLAKAHPLGLWHGSLCPEHLFSIEAAGAPFLKLANFGDVAAETWANDPASQLSPDAPSRRQAYLSPEQLLHGAGSSAAADCWALSVLLYELLTTTLPFEAATSAGVSVAICNAQFSPPSHYRADLPPAVDAWFSRVFAKDRSTRLVDASLLAREFGRAIGESRAAGVGAEAVAAGARAVPNEDDYDADERTVRWDLPSDWALPQGNQLSSGSFPAPPAEPPQPFARPSLLPSIGPPPLPDRPPSSRPPPPFPGYAPTLSLRAPTGRLLSLPPRATLLPGAVRATLPDAREPSFAQRYRFTKAQGLAAGALLGGALAFLAWGMQSWPESNDSASEAGTATRTAPLAAADSARDGRSPAASAGAARTARPSAAAARTGSLHAGSRHAAESADTENLPIILQTDELPRAPEETDDEADGTSDVQGGAGARAAGSTSAHAATSTSAASPAGAKSEPKPAARSSARPDPAATAPLVLAKPKPAAALTAAPPRRETPHRSPKQSSASADCNPPYFFDKNNIRRLKLECL